MIGIYAIGALALIAWGGVLGMVMVVCLGIRREEKRGSLTVNSPGRAASGARTIMAVSSRQPGIAYQIRAQQEDDLAA